MAKKHKKDPKRKEKSPCPACHVKGNYSISEAFDGRPAFTCNTCGNEWTCGHSGGEYMEVK